MSNVLAIARRELQSYFVSATAYAILAVFTFIIGWFFAALVLQYSGYSMRAGMNPAMAAQINVDDLVIRSFYSTFGVIMLFVTPIISMRLLAEERRLGTAEMLLTSPVSTMQLVLGKYLGALGFGAVMLLLTVQFPLYLTFMGARPEPGTLLAVYLGALLMTGAFIAVGLFCSSLTSNQVIAGFTGFVLCLFFWVVGFMGEVGGLSEYSDLLKSISISEHFQGFLKGIVDSGAVVYYVTFIAFGLFLTGRVIDSGRWR